MIIYHLTYGQWSKSSLVYERCYFDKEIECKDYLLDSTNSELKLRLKSDMKDVINIAAWSLSDYAAKSLNVLMKQKHTLVKSGLLEKLEISYLVIAIMIT